MLNFTDLIMELLILVLGVMHSNLWAAWWFSSTLLLRIKNATVCVISVHF